MSQRVTIITSILLGSLVLGFMVADLINSY